MDSDIDLDNNIVDYYSSVKFYKKRIKELEIEIYKMKLEIDYLKRLLALNHIKYE